MEKLERDPSLLSREDIIFEFEDFLEEHEENLPEGLDAEYMTYVPILEKPFSNLRKVPKALTSLPINAVLHQTYGTIFSLYAIILILAIPHFAFLIYTSVFVDKVGVAISFIFLILIGGLASVTYLKYIYGSINNLMESRKAGWLVSKIRKQFNDNYQRDWNERIFMFAMILPFATELPLVYTYLDAFDFNIPIFSSIFWFTMLLIGHFGIGMMMYCMILSFRYIQINTRIYDQVLQTIIDRVAGYTEGHESILNKKNYEVVGVLSDTPGLSVRSLGDIPVFGLGSGILSVNALIFLVLSPLLLSGPVADFFQSTFGVPGGDELGLNMVILIGIIISSIASFGAVIGPLIRIARVMGSFKHKALSELDPFIFDEITGVALRKDTEISNETQVLFMIRAYIYTMKVSPVSPFRLIYIVGITVIYSLRILPNLIGLLSSLGA